APHPYFLPRRRCPLGVPVVVRCVRGARTNPDRRRVHGAGGAEFSAVDFGLPALSVWQTSFILDHDLVSVRTGRAHGGGYILPRPGLVLGVALEELIAIIPAIDEEQIVFPVADVVRPSGARVWRGQPAAVDIAGHRTGQESLQRMAPLPEQISRADSGPRGGGNTAAPLPRRHPADLAAAVRSRRSLYHLPRWIERGQSRRCQRPAVPCA